MKLNKSELFALFVSLILLIGTVSIYLAYGDRNTVDVAQTASWKEEATANFIAEAEAIVEQLEATPTDDLLADAKVAIKRVTDTTIRQQLTKKIETIENAQNQLKTAQEALTKLEAEQTPANLEAAQTAVNAVTLANQKTELQNRLEAVRANLAAQQAAAEQQAQAAPAAQPAQPVEAPAPVVAAPEPVVVDVPATE